MKLRTTPHTPALSSKVYRVGKTTLTLIPGSLRLFRRVTAIANRLAETDAAKEAMLPAGEICCSLFLALTWDDPVLELEAGHLDRLEALTDDAAIALASAVMDELEATSIRTLLPLQELAQAASYAVMGADDQSDESAPD